ncbi:hypothetical protein ACWGOQ_0014810 [Aquimarina sp. M1]
MKGICRICGEHKKLTFEHIPPESAYNRKPVYFQKSEHLHDTKSYLYGKRMRSNQGAGGYYLCKQCNNNTGSWYGASYKQFVDTGIFVCHYKVHSYHRIPFIYTIKPLNVLKQILSMFMSIDSGGQLLNHPGLKDFILSKESQSLPPDIRVFIYYTTAKSLRNGWGIIRSNFAYHTLGELTYNPFGLCYTISSPPIRDDFFEITSFRNYKFNERARVNLKMPFLIPKTYIPGLYI